MRRRFVVLAALMVTSVAGTAQQRDVTLWVTLGDIDQLVEVDAFTFKEIRRITVDPKPHGLSASADGSKIYLASDRTGNFQIVDVRTGRVAGQIPLGKDPNQMTLTKDGRFAYVPMRGEDQVAVVQLDPLKLIKKIPTPKGPHDAYTGSGGRRIYVGAQYGNAIAVIDPDAQSMIETIETADGVRPMQPTATASCCTPPCPTSWDSSSSIHGSGPSLRRVELGTLPDGIPQPYLETWTHAMQLVNNDQELWVTDCINDLVRIVRTSDLKEVAQIRVGHFPHWFTMRPDGKVVFVSLWYSDAVAAIDVESRKVLTNLQFARGSGPKRILVTPKVAAATSQQ